MADTSESCDAVATTLCTLRVHRPTLFDAVSESGDVDRALDALGRSLAMSLLGGETDVAARLQFAVYGIEDCDFTYPAPEGTSPSSVLKPLKFRKLQGASRGKIWRAEVGIFEYFIAKVSKGEYILDVVEDSECKGRRLPGPFKSRKAAEKAAKKHYRAALNRLFKKRAAREILADVAAPKAAAPAEAPTLRVKPLVFEEMDGISGDFLMADTDLAEYQIRNVEITDQYLLTLGSPGSKLRKTLDPFPSLAAAMQAANEHHVGQVSKLLEPDDAKRTKASLRLLEDALAHIPDEVDLYRLIKAPKQSSRHADIAKRIAAHLAPALAAVELFQDEMEKNS